MLPRKVPTGFLDGGVGLINDGSPVTVAKLLEAALDVDSDVTVTDLEAATEVNGQLGGRVIASGNWWRWDAASLVNDATSTVSVRPTSIAADEAGRWILDLPIVLLSFPITFETTNEEVLFEVPDGVVIHPLSFWWEIGTNFSGGSSSAIGVSSDKTGFTAAGSLLGGSSGNVAAELTTALSPTLGKVGSRAYPGASRLVRETVAVATAAATPSYAIEQLLYAKTVGTGAPAVKAAKINGATPSAGEAAPNAGGTSVAFNAETTGTGTAELWYLTSAPALATENTLFKTPDQILFNRITSVFTAGAGAVVMCAKIVYP
jgi:hypothetical protein